MAPPAGFVAIPQTDTAQSQYDVASWQVGQGPKILFPVLSLTDTIGNRLVQHKRPYRAGAKIDSTGAEPRQWNLTALFANNLEEPGIDPSTPLFPDQLRLLQESFDTQETGDLVIPGIGSVRARAQTMTSTETFDESDSAHATLLFVADNEEALEASLVRPATARATTQRLAEATTFTAQSAGAWDGDLNGLVEFAAGVEDLLLAPGRATNAVDTQVRRNRRAIERIVEAQQQLAQDVGLDFNQPRGSATERSLLALKDRQAQAASERSQGRPRTISFVVDVNETTIFDVAARFDQDADELLELNDSRIADPFALRRGSTVLVFETRTR